MEDTWDSWACVSFSFRPSLRFIEIIGQGWRKHLRNSRWWNFFMKFPDVHPISPHTHCGNTACCENQLGWRKKNHTWSPQNFVLFISIFLWPRSAFDGRFSNAVLHCWGKLAQGVRKVELIMSGFVCSMPNPSRTFLILTLISMPPHLQAPGVPEDNHSQISSLLTLHHLWL